MLCGSGYSMFKHHILVGLSIDIISDLRPSELKHLVRSPPLFLAVIPGGILDLSVHSGM